MVAGFSHNSVDFLVLMHACLRAGAVFAPMNVSLRRDELTATMERLQARLVVASRELLGQHGDLLTDTKLVPRSVPLEDVVSEGGAAPQDPPTYRWKAGEWSWVIFSGATTGMPKGIMLPHGYATAHAHRVIESIDLTQDDKWFSSLQMCHAWLDFVVLASCLLAGCHCAATRWFSASRWLSQVRDFGATVVDPYLPMASAIVGQPPTPRDKDHKVRVCPTRAMGTVAELDRRLAFERRFGIRTINCTGLTEAGGLAAAESLRFRRDGATGKASADFEVIIADDEGNRLPPNEQGEILYRPTRANIAALGYLNDHERTVKAWRNLSIHTGDNGYMDEDGFLFLVGRQPHWLRRKGKTSPPGRSRRPSARSTACPMPRSRPSPPISGMTTSAPSSCSNSGRR